MSKILMREGLAHSNFTLKDSEFFEMIDATGGWPVGYRYVGFEHTDERDAGFCNSPRNTGWWTVVADSDDYYMWKLSAAALQRIADAVVSIDPLVGSKREPHQHQEFQRLHRHGCKGGSEVSAEEQFIQAVGRDMTAIGVIAFVAGVVASVLVQAVVS